MGPVRISSLTVAPVGLICGAPWKLNHNSYQYSHGMGNGSQFIAVLDKRKSNLIVTWNFISKQYDVFTTRPFGIACLVSVNVLVTPTITYRVGGNLINCFHVLAVMGCKYKKCTPNLILHRIRAYGCYNGTSLRELLTCNRDHFVYAPS